MQVDVGGLAAGTKYYYRFTVAGVDTISYSPVPFTVRSPTGVFRLPHPEGE